MMRVATEELIDEKIAPLQGSLVKTLELTEMLADICKNEFVRMEAEVEELENRLTRIETMCLGRAGA